MGNKMKTMNLLLSVFLMFVFAIATMNAAEIETENKVETSFIEIAAAAEEKSQLMDDEDDDDEDDEDDEDDDDEDDEADSEDDDDDDEDDEEEEEDDEDDEDDEEEDEEESD